MYRKSPTSADSSRFKFEHRFLTYTRNEWSIEELKQFRERIDQEIKRREYEVSQLEDAIDIVSTPMNEGLVKWFNEVVKKRKSGNVVEMDEQDK